MSSLQGEAAKKGGSGPGLSEEERSQVAEAQRPRPVVIYEIIRTEGENEPTRPFSSLWWSGVAAGISIGFSFVGQAALAAYLPDAVWKPFVTSFGYALGFLIVILARQQLFTENVMTAVLLVVSRLELSWLLSMLRLWGIVLTANMVVAMPWKRPDIGSRVTREGHARFWERLRVKVPRATRHFEKGSFRAYLSRFAFRTGQSRREWRKAVQDVSQNKA